MQARFIRFLNFVDRAYKQKPVAERNPGLDFPVYCKDCAYLEKVKGVLAEQYNCSHKSNKLIIPSDKSWYSSEEGSTYIQHPKNKNARNNCNYFSPRCSGSGGGSKWEKLKK